MEDPSLGAQRESVERDIATRLWPQHAEMCSERDWAVIRKAVETEQPFNAKILQPIGEAKDEILASLMILYWAMKVTRLAIEISREVSETHGKAKAEAVLKAVTNRMDGNTPKIVSSRIHDIIAALGYE